MIIKQFHPPYSFVVIEPGEADSELNVYKGENYTKVFHTSYFAMIK